MSLFNEREVVETDLLSVRILNEVAPVIDTLEVPVNCTVPVEGVNVPLFIQLRNTVCVYVPDAKAVEASMVISQLTVIAPAAVLVLPLDKIR